MAMSKQAPSDSSTPAPSASGASEAASSSPGPASSGATDASAAPPARGPARASAAGGGATPLSRLSARTDDLADVHFLTVAEVASVMRVSKMTVYRMVHGGELPAVRVGRSFRVPEQAVHDYLRAAFIEAG